MSPNIEIDALAALYRNGDTIDHDERKAEDAREDGEEFIKSDFTVVGIDTQRECDQGGNSTP